MSENDPYGQHAYGQNPYGGGPAAGGVPHPRGTTVLVLGILGLVCCGLLAPVAWFMGSQADREVSAEPWRWSNAGTVKAGKILGIVGTLLMVIGFLAVVVIFLFGGLLGLASVTETSSAVEYNF